MPGFTVRVVVDRTGAERLLLPRDDVVGERAVAAGPGETARFTLDHGPFARYERTVTLVPADGQIGPEDDDMAWTADRPDRPDRADDDAGDAGDHPGQR